MGTVNLDLGAGRAVIAGVATPIGVGRHGVIHHGETALRPLTFGERTSAVRAAAHCPDPVDALARAAYSLARVRLDEPRPDTSAVPDPDGDLIAQVLALVLAGAEDEPHDTPGFVEVALLAVRATGWTPDQLDTALAADVDMLARALAAPPADAGADRWTRLRLDPGTPERVRADLAADLLVRAARRPPAEREAPWSPASAQPHQTVTGRRPLPAASDQTRPDHTAAPLPAGADRALGGFPPPEPAVPTRSARIGTGVTAAVRPAGSVTGPPPVTPAGPTGFRTAVPTPASARLGTVAAGPTAFRTAVPRSASAHLGTVLPGPTGLSAASPPDRPARAWADGGPASGARADRTRASDASQLWHGTAPTADPEPWSRTSGSPGPPDDVPTDLGAAVPGHRPRLSPPPRAEESPPGSASIGGRPRLVELDDEELAARLARLLQDESDLRGLAP